MDIRPYQNKKTVSDIQTAPKKTPERIPTLEEEYGEWFTVPADFESEEPFVPPVFEYTPKKKSRRFHFFSKRLPSTGIILGVFVIGYFVVSGAFLFFTKSTIETKAEQGFVSLEAAKTSLTNEEFNAAKGHFSTAKNSFEEAEGAIPFWTVPALFLTQYIPGLSEGASARNVLRAGVHIALAGSSFVDIAGGVQQKRQNLGTEENFSILELFQETKKPLLEARKELGQAEVYLAKVDAQDIPEEKRKNFILAKEQLPAFLAMIDTLESHEAVIEELLGDNGPRKYLFLLQNNHEMRATGGFIGTYALLEMTDGKIKNFFVDGIFNPDGQLRENIVPPKPLQKVSAGWSLHDSNWFPHFPTSAEKAIFFYEKTGGPTVDGVFTVTPIVLQKILTKTGPIELPEYGITVTSENFFPVIQEEVEVNYDKTENKPKAVLADLSEVLFAKILSSRDEETLLAIMKILIESLNEKHILLYVRDDRVENIIQNAGWSGAFQETDKDFVSVVNSNINGYKTDGVIDEKIHQKVEIQDDGSVINTLSITRKHTGGNTPYEWWNKVNANYMRVYVPEGSELISATGQTYEINEPPLDYDALGFKRDPDVVQIEATEQIDPETGTRIGVETGKTFFGNWVYVSPQEEVVMQYVYKLPFRVTPGGTEVGSSSYSLIYQKQAGALAFPLEVEIHYPESWEPIWQTGRNLVPYEHTFRFTDSISTDLFFGFAFERAE